MMRTKTSNSFFLLPLAIAGFLLLAGSTYAQEKSENQPKAKKTITIHVTRDVDGNTTVIDTTIVTDGEFDADAFLREKGVLKDMPEVAGDMRKEIIIRRPDMKEFRWNDSEGNMPDTISFDDDNVFVFRGKPGRQFSDPHERIEFKHNFRMPEDFQRMQSPRFEDMLEDLFRSNGLDEFTPFGEMKQMVVKKKLNGKKVIITFEDREGGSADREHGNRHEKRVLIYKNDDQGMAPRNEERVIIRRSPGEKVIINEEVDKAAPANQQKKIIIIKEEKTK